MVRHMRDLGEMAAALALAGPEMALHLHHGLERVAKVIEATAKAEIGHYQDAVGPFPGWPELAESTKDDRVRKGYTENDPLLRSGELLESIGHQVDGLEAQVGSTSELMVFHEFGTQRMPARPVLGPAAFRNKETIHLLLGAAAVSGLLGPVGVAGPVLPARIHADLGYDFKTTD